LDEGVGEDACVVHIAIDDVVHQGTAGWVECGEVTHPLGDLVVRAGRIAADAEATDHASVAIEGHPTAKGNDAARHLVHAAAGRLRGAGEGARVERVGVVDPVERVAGLD
jgi:hypothetical protein